ncbi:transporter substrate-binding domain-containing protein, partial [Cobetia sp. SIMBA_158]
ERNNTKYVFSDPLITVTEMLVTLPENTKKWQHVSNIEGKNVGTVLGYYYHNADTFKRVDFPSEKELIEALVRKRVDVAIIGDSPT